MPSKSKKQARFMAACNSPEFRKNSTTECPPLSVVKEFAAADRRAKKKKGKMKTRGKMVRKRMK